MIDEYEKRSMQSPFQDSREMNGPDDDPYDIPYHADDTLHRTVLLLQEELRMLQEDHELLEEEKNRLEIDNICLHQQKQSLESRINDLVQTYPSARVLRGNTPDCSTMKQKGFSNRIFKRNKK